METTSLMSRGDGFIDRSELMRRVRGKDTKPEIVVRRVAFSIGLRFRLHRADLPGRPDLVFPSRRKVVFVHGCFWHRHHGCTRSSTPGSNRDFWIAKFDRNVERDARKERELREAGWDVLIIWECQTRDPTLVTKRLRGFFFPAGEPQSDGFARPQDQTG